MKQLKSIYRYLGIALIVVICFTAISTYFFLRSDNAVGPNLITAFVGVVLSALITLLLLNGQTNAEEFKQKNIKVFEEKLDIYKKFMGALCTMVKDLKIDPSEEIKIQFQIANLATHTSDSSINKISKLVEDIVTNIKMRKRNRNEMIEPLLKIADVFRQELYDEYKRDNKDNDPIRQQTIGSFKTILALDDFSEEKSGNDSKQSIEDHETPNTTEDRLKYLSNTLQVPCERQWIYNGYILVHEFNNDISPKTGNLVKGDNRIVVDMYLDEKRIQITLFTRQYDESKSRELVDEIWQGKVKYNPNDDKTRHVCADLPVETSDDEIVTLMTTLLNDVKQYQVKKYKLEH